MLLTFNIDTCTLEISFWLNHRIEFEMALFLKCKPSTFNARCVTVPSTWSLGRSFSTPVNDVFSIQASAADVDRASTLKAAVSAQAPRHDWTRDEIREIYNTPLMELAFQAVGARPLARIHEQLGLMKV